MHVYLPPVFDHPNEAMINLDCAQSGYDRDVPGYPTYSMIGSDHREHNLMVVNSQLSDDAEYQCQVTPGGPGHPRLTASAHLTVLGEQVVVFTVNVGLGVWGERGREFIVLLTVGQAHPSLTVWLLFIKFLMSVESLCFVLLGLLMFCFTWLTHMSNVWIYVISRRGANPSVLGGRSSALRNFSRSSVRSQNLPLTKTQNLPLILSVSKLSRDCLFH